MTIRSTVFGVWLLLVAVTGVTWLLGNDHGEVALSGMLALSFLKVWLVGEWFMELREAPSWLRRAFGAWVVVVGAAVVAGYFAG